MNYKKIIREKMENNGGIITSKEVKKSNIPTIYLMRMVEEGVLIRADRGVYLDSNGDFDEYYFFSKRYQTAIFSYISSLYLHGFTDIIPQGMEVTVYKGYNSHRLKGKARVHFVTKAIYDLGISECMTVYGNQVKAYDLERTICDLIKNRNEVDSELFTKTLHKYVRSSDKDFQKLQAYSQKMGIEEKVREIIGLLYE